MTKHRDGAVWRVGERVWVVREGAVDRDDRGGKIAHILDPADQPEKWLPRGLRYCTAWCTPVVAGISGQESEGHPMIALGTVRLSIRVLEYLERWLAGTEPLTRWLTSLFMVSMLFLISAAVYRGD